MLTHRIIPCLLLNNGGLYKTIKFSKPKYVGDPINAIRIFNEKEVDELMVLDISASREKREPNYDYIEDLAGECFMPLAYGGGITSVEQAKRLFSIGVEKVTVQTGVLENFELVSDIAARYGNQSVVLSVDIKRNLLGKPLIYSSALATTIKGDWLEYIKNAVDAGAGEVLLNAVDKDGTLSGMDLDLINRAAGTSTVPLIAIGGAGSLSDLKMAVDAGADAVAAGSFFVFYGPYRAVLITYPKYGDLEQLLRK
jgi:cyclase